MNIKKRVLTLAVLSALSVSAMAADTYECRDYANDERNEGRDGRP